MVQYKCSYYFCSTMETDDANLFLEEGSKDEVIWLCAEHRFRPDSGSYAEYKRWLLGLPIPDSVNTENFDKIKELPFKMVRCSCCRTLYLSHLVRGNTQDDVLCLGCYADENLENHGGYKAVRESIRHMDKTRVGSFYADVATILSLEIEDPAWARQFRVKTNTPNHPFEVDWTNTHSTDLVG